MSDKILYFEEVTSSIGPQVISSEIRVATPEEVEECKKLADEGNCPHTIIRDSYGWLYDMRMCAVCGEFLGFA